MKLTTTKLSVKGRMVVVPAVEIEGREVIVAGRFPRIASIKDEEWIESDAPIQTDSFLAQIRLSRLGADIFSFSDPLGTDTTRLASIPTVWDNAAVVPLQSYSDWWENRVPQETRKNVRRSQRRGVTVRQVELDDALVAGIKDLYDETPLRQGRPFWHYGKDLETVRRENSSYLDRSEFFGAFFEEKLIGFIKVVYVRKVARIMQILSANAHFDKRPPNALLAKAIERAAEKGMQYFVYGKHIYGNKANSPVTEFKRRNGFEELRFPRYFVPVNLRGNIALALRLHLGLRNLLPEPVTEFALRARSRLLAWKNGQAKETNARETANSAVAD